MSCPASNRVAHSRQVEDEDAQLGGNQARQNPCCRDHFGSIEITLDWCDVS